MLMNNCATLQAHSFLPFFSFHKILKKKEKKRREATVEGQVRLKGGGRERTEGRVKVVRPPDQKERDKGGPVCSTQRQIERIAFFVPQNFSITMCILLPGFYPLLTSPHQCLPASKKGQLDL